MRTLARTLPAMLAAVLALATLPTRPLAQGAPQVERPAPFDSAGRVVVVTPALASRWGLLPPPWPVGAEGWREARLYARDDGSAVLVVTRTDGSVARYAYTADEVATLRRQVAAGVVAQGLGGGAERGATGLELSQPAGNVFIRNQVTLGLFAYGPATAALLSDNGPAAAGGYLVAAGGSYFVAAQLIRNRTVTRAQTALAFHGGSRGAAAGAAIAAIADASGGPGWGAPILAGAIGGTVAGFRGARGMSDGEAASAGLVSDLAAATTLLGGVMLGAFGDDQRDDDFVPPEDRSRDTEDKVALGAAVVAGLGGALVGPTYARRARHNVTQGDVSLVYSSALLGALAMTGTFPDDPDEKLAAGLVTTGLLGGAVLGDRLFARRADRTAADGTLAQLGAAAGALMGSGVALIVEANRQVATALIAVGGWGGMALADRGLRPAPDAGPQRGVLRATAMRRDAPPRLSLSLVPAAATLGAAALRAPQGPAGTRVVQASLGRVTF